MTGGGDVFTDDLSEDFASVLIHTAGIEHWSSVLRVGLHQSLYLRTQHVTGCSQVRDNLCQLWQPDRCGVRADNHNGLGLKCGEDPVYQALVHLRGELLQAGRDAPLTGLQICDLAHRQARQGADRDAGSLGYRDRQRPDPGWLINDEQDCAVRGQLVDHRLHLGFVAGQGFVLELLPVPFQGHGVVFAFAHVDARKRRNPYGYCSRAVSSGRTACNCAGLICGGRARHPRYERPRVLLPGPYQRCPCHLQAQ